MTPDALARLQAPFHHLVPHGLFLCFRQLGQRWVLADLVELTVVDGHGFEAAAAVSNGLPEQGRARRPIASVLQSAS